MSPSSPLANSAAALLRQQQQQQHLPPGATTGYVVQPNPELQRHASLPTRRPFSPTAPTMGPPPARRPSHRAQPSSIMEDSEARDWRDGDVNLGRSKSWRPVRDDGRYGEREFSGAMLSRGVTTSASDHVRAHYRQGGHVRSQSNASQFAAPGGGSTETSPLESAFSHTAYHPRTTLHKSASLRSTASQSSNPSLGQGQGQGGYARSVLTRGRASPGNASLNWDHLASPTFAKSEDNHGVQMARLATSQEETPRGIPGPLAGMGREAYNQTTQRLQSEAQGADVRRHQSLQQGFGHSTKVQERLARSQALLPPEQRTSYVPEHEPAERERRTSDLSARNVWGAGSRVVGNDGWEQVDVAMRARANHTPVNSSNALGQRENRTPPTGEFTAEMMQDPYAGMQRDTLMQAFQAMQLGNDMLGPAVPSDPSISNLADLYRSNLMTHGQTGYDADYGYPRALGPPAEAALPYPGYAPLAQPTPFPTFPTTSTNTSAPYNAPFTQSLSQSSHPHAQTPVVPDHIARAAEAEVHQMIANRHLNPVDFHCEPENARFFVIKSFTEDDVHKSLKHEIWASTTYGNQRLDKAFQEARGPVYLFFSVNGSGHFCGVAQMISPVDYNQTSTVWAQDKWKGIFKLRWIFVKDIPNGALRHIRLINTQEQKPITNSRDTQELLWHAGCEVLAIFSNFREKTSLLQDWGFHEMQALEKARRAQHSPNPNGAPEGSDMPPSHSYGDDPRRPHTPDQRGPKQSGLVKGFSATGPPSLGGQNAGFSVVGRGSKPGTKIF